MTSMAGATDQHRVDHVAAAYRYLADAEFAGYCPAYERVARGAADDADFLALVARLDTPARRVPVLLNAAVHYLALGGDAPTVADAYASVGTDPWPAYRALVRDRFDQIAALVSSRAIQTNEVGRSAPIRCALAATHHLTASTLALVEIGTSAGLNLAFDRYRITWLDPTAGDRTAGPAASPVRLTCEVRGPLRPPVPDEPVPVEERIGIDPEPVDVTDPEACRWLRACLWPQIPDRERNLTEALGLAAEAPPRLVAGTAGEQLARVLAEIPADRVPVVLSTWVLPYIPRAERPALLAELDGLGATRELAFVTAENPTTVDWVDPPARPAASAGGAATLLALHRWHGGGRTITPLAWMHAHGRWIDWLDDATSDGPR